MQLLILYFLSSVCSAGTWGRLNFPDQNTKVTLIRTEGRAGAFAYLDVNSAGQQPQRIGLSEAQFNELTGWLHFNFLKEQQLRNRRKERTACAAKGLTFTIEPGLLNMDLCRDITRHAMLTRRTAMYLQSYMASRAVASSKARPSKKK